MSIEIPEQTPAVPRKPSTGRPRKAKAALPEPMDEPTEGNGNGILMEPEFDLERFGDYLDTLTVDFLVKNFDETRLRSLCQHMSDTLDRCRKRLQHLETTRTALLCTHCHKPLPGGRFAGEIVIRDDLTGELQALRACSEACYREVSRIANERRAKHQGSVRGTVAM